MSELSHIDNRGKAKMVDVGGKEHTVRKATASVRVRLNEETFRLVRENRLNKGDVLTVAKIAGIQGAKRTSDLIPLCHPLSIDHIDVEIELDESDFAVVIRSTVGIHGQTGVEMEALTACSVTALTVYDMVKAVQKDVIIDDLKLLFKTGGKSGEFQRHDS